MDSSQRSGMSVSRPLGPQELEFLSFYNIGIHRCCACSARYTNPGLSPEAGLAAIRTGLDVIIDRVPALSTVFAFDKDTQTHVLARTPRRPVHEIHLCDGIDLDLGSSSYREWKGKIVDTPIDTRDPERPPWRVFVLRAAATTANEFDARVVFVYSHAIMDGKCGPFFHELLSEILCAPKHPYRASLPVDAHNALEMPSIATVWDFEALARSQQWSLSRCLRPLTHLVLAAYHALRQLWMPAKLLRYQPTVIKTISFDSGGLQRLLEQSRANGVTLTNVMNACAAWALASARQAVSHRASVYDTTIMLDMAATLRPGHPSSIGLVPGIGLAAATKLDAILPRNSAFHSLFLCAPWARQQKVRVARSLKFWDLCRDNRRMLTDQAAVRKGIADWIEKPPVLDFGRYQRRFLEATSDDWDKASLSPRVLTGLESGSMMEFLTSKKYPMHSLTNSGASRLSQGAGWTINGLSRAITNVETPYIMTLVCSCSSGLVLNTIYHPSRCSDEEAEVFVRMLEAAMVAVSEGTVPHEGTLGGLM